MNSHLDSIGRPAAASPPPTVTLLERHRGRLRGPAPGASKAEGWIELAYVNSGNGFLQGGLQSQPLRPGDLVLAPAGSPLRIEDSKGDPLGLYTVVIPRGVLARATVEPEGLPAGRLALEGPCASHVAHSMRRLLFEQSRSDPQGRAALEAHTIELLSSLPAIAEGQAPAESSSVRRLKEGPGQERMQSYVSSLEQRFFEETTIDQAASLLDLSRRRFTQLFREVTGTTWLSHLRKLRIQHARHVLTDTRRTVQSVAFECGFDDLSTFYRAFKREAGTSPNRWRQDHVS